jgi:lipopolysaccharide transport system ATP-binding protein
MSESAIQFVNAGKMYKIFSSRGANLLDALGFGRLLPKGLVQHQEFWALRGIDLTVKRGARLGIIGRNGAGKTTLLKLITGNLAPNEGSIEVTGGVQSLLDAGGGLHPEFTGRENIRAALTYQGIAGTRIRQIEGEIVEFTELGDFIDRPFKTYSLGMQARLAFTVATSVNPEILVVDEMLGAGDAYFFGKSSARMHALVASGATVLIVSHGLDQIVRFCDQAIWLDRGQIVARGDTLDVVKAYEKFIRVLEDRRLRGKNVKVSSKRFRGLESEGYADSVIVRVTVRGPKGTRCEVQEAALFRDDLLEDRVLVGSPQDADLAQSSLVQLDEGDWSAPLQTPDGFCRALEVLGEAEGEDIYASGTMKIFCWAFEGDRRHTAELRYRTTPGAWTSLEIVQGDDILKVVALPASAEWRLERVDVSSASEELAAAESKASPNEPAFPRPYHAEPDPAEPRAGAGADLNLEENLADPDEAAPADDVSVPPVVIANLSRWPGEGTLSIDSVAIVDQDEQERTVLSAGKPMRVRVGIRARESGSFALILASLIFTLDGIVATRHISPPCQLEMELGQMAEAVLDLGDLRFGNGYYVLSIGLYRKLDIDDIEAPQIYDYLDRSFEFQVVGNPRLHNELFRHPGEWSLSTRALPTASGESRER